MSGTKFIILFMVCTPVIAVVQGGKFSGKQVVTAEFIDEMSKVYKMEIWDSSLLLILHEILRYNIKFYCIIYYIH